ncbi:hypothetical protein [Pseudomonas reactans]|uniref:hypothetical protein n=1 Tax=Pseudomonas reactans TaxID=117680 RepID=UPI0015A44325|nr:hypothetical protein [Pseudomonas reactans]NWA65904.1 hypothetical protein [Pseudomonas reactans]
MATRKTFENAKGTLTASINGTANFIADTVHLTHKNGLITVVGVDEDSTSPLRIIQIEMVADIPNGKHDFPGNQIRALEGGANTPQANYLTSSGRVDVDFGHEIGRYKGQFNFTAINVFPPKNTIKVVGTFAIDTAPSQPPEQ